MIGEIILGLTALDQMFNKPKPMQNTVGAQVPATALPAGSAAYPLPMPQGQGSNIHERALKMNQQLFEDTAKRAAALTGGPPPTVPLSAPAVAGATPAAQQQLPPQAAGAPAQVGEILAAAPQALAAVSALLGIGQEQGTHQQAAPIPGGTAGNLVQGFNLPQQNQIGQLLAQIPRFR